MSAINSTFGRMQADRRRPVGNTGLADADQRNVGLFGFLREPRDGGLAGRLGLGRPGAARAPEPAGTIAPSSVTPVNAAGTVDSFANLFDQGGGLTPLQLDVISRQSPETQASITEVGREAAGANEILRRAQENLSGFQVGGSALGQDLDRSLRNTLANPEAISEAAREAAIARSTDTILGIQRTNQERLQESLAARGISDSGLQFALSQAGRETAGRDIASAGRDVMLAAELARSQREAQIQALAAQVEGNRDVLGLRQAEGVSGLINQEEVPVAPFATIEANTAFDSVVDATDEEDADRRIRDFVGTLLGGALALGLGQVVRRRLG